MIERYWQIVLILFGISFSAGCGDSAASNNNIDNDDPNIVELHDFSFDPVEKKAMFDLDNHRYKVGRICFDTPPYSLDEILEEYSTYNLEIFGYTDEFGKISIPLKEEYSGHTNLILFFQERNGQDTLVGYIELLRTSAKWLEENYSFIKEEGYTILKRNNLKLWIPEILVHYDDQFAIPVQDKSKLPNLPDYYPDALYPKEILESVAVCRFIWDGYIQIGPSNNNSIYFKLDPIERLQALRTGQWSAQCSAIQNLFCDFAVQSNTNKNRVKRVRLFQYWPQWPDLIPQSHAAAEIFCEEWNKWVLLDTYYVCLFSYNGDLLSAEEMMNMDFAERKKITIIEFDENQSIYKLRTWIDPMVQYSLYLGCLLYNDYFPPSG